ncbi:hypothetical protein SCHPADRAFT_838778 [Schizopora paradoxa]|uniref:Tetraspanin Tsp2 n=1 Tax=Schizopora paradoxa TaxID=27342 RepID=A0A0H2R8Q8_9AGAM|nr:hypothetical protein SCHPADRAFT_838778 [Schizopora paradoxa]
MTSSRSLNYIPSKFSRPPSLTMPRRRSSVVPVPFPKSGGGREAFRPSEDRMPGEGDEDYDGVDVDVQRLRRLWPFSRGVKEREKIPERLLGWRWNKFKWVLLCTTSMVMLYSIASLVFCLLTWFNVLEHADIVRVGNRRELAVSTLAASMGILTSLVGWAGLLLNNRSFLAAYNLLLWLTFATLLAPGYLTYKQRTFNLEGKINAQWSQTLDLTSRLRIQNRLGCCGYYNAFVEATVSNTCYARSVLPACKGKFLDFEKMVLGRWYTAAFALVPPHMAAMFAGLLCSNHVTYRYGKGMMPKAYRLNMHTMAIVIDEYAK